jgi:hypothetical protein
MEKNNMPGWGGNRLLTFPAMGIWFRIIENVLKAELVRGRLGIEIPRNHLSFVVRRPFMNAVINPSWMRFAARHRPQKFVQFAERIFGLKAKGADDLDCAW